MNSEESEAPLINQIEEWLKQQKEKSPDEKDLETLLEENPDISVIRGVEGEVSIWTYTSDGRRRLITLATDRHSFDISLTSYKLPPEGDLSVPAAYTYIRSETNKYLRDAAVYSNERDLNLIELLNQTVAGLEIFKLFHGSSVEEQSKYSNRVRDFSSRNREEYNTIYLNRMLGYLGSKL